MGMRSKPSKSEKVTTIRSLKLHEWVEADRQAWSDACESGGRLRRGGSASHLKFVTRDDLAGRYGLFLNFVQRNEGFLPSGVTAAVTEVHVAAYIFELQARVCSVTVHGSIAKLRRAAQLLSPDRDLSWLQLLENDLALAMRPMSKFDRVVDSQLIVKAGIRLMMKAEKVEKATLLKRAERYRDGLMIALLAACPIRIKNFATLTIGRSFITVGSTWQIALAANDTKERRPDERPVPDFLVDHINRYIEVHRPAFKAPGNALWVGRYKNPMKINSVARVITETTSRRLGKGISPHLFRASAASTAYLHGSSMPHLASALLSHRDQKTTEDHYNRTKSIEFSRKYNSLLGEIRN